MSSFFKKDKPQLDKYLNLLDFAIPYFKNNADKKILEIAKEQIRTGNREIKKDLASGILCIQATMKNMIIVQ